ncbi:MAG: hypothetical protein EHM78_21315 [Myxococcaceae bacterium]|nr:MAG: hypothetical protein EHM78_21315 [Myxococcaceae bacterium]
MRDSMVAAMEWFRDEFGRSLQASTLTGSAPVPIPPGTAEVYRELDALLQALALFPVRRVFMLRDLDSPYLLTDVLRAFSLKALAYKVDGNVSSTERAANGAAVDRMVARARSLTGRLEAMPVPEGKQQPMHARLPPGAVLRRLVGRG